jgi:hypothetical protein
MSPLSQEATPHPKPLGLPDTSRVSSRSAILWIAFGNGILPEDFAGSTLWLSQNSHIKDARSSLWSALADGLLKASALGPDGAPAIIGQHEWGFLIGRQMITLSMTAHPADGLYVETPATLTVGSSLRFTKATVPRIDVMSIWPPRTAAVPASIGRPTIMPELETQLDKWIAGGSQALLLAMKKYGQSGQTTLRAIAKALEQWAIENGLKGHDDAPTPRAIENRLREKLRLANNLL